jgi:predicted ester cyclase
MHTAEKLAREVLDALSSGDIERAGPLVAEDFIDHGAPSWAPQGSDGYLQILGFLHTVLRLRYELHEVVAAGDMVAIRATAHGVHNSGHGLPGHRQAGLDARHAHVPAGQRGPGRALGRAGRASRAVAGRCAACAGTGCARSGPVTAARTVR